MGGVTHNEILNGAITQLEVYDQESGVTPAIAFPTPTTVAAEKVINGVGGRKRVIEFSCYVSGNFPSESTSAEIAYVFAIFRGSVELRRMQVSMACVSTTPPVGSGATQHRYGQEFSIRAVDFAGAANQNYSVRFARGSTQGTGSHQATYRFMTIEELKA